jgi:pimeloyl-ACP methyl ester carboxylesterase
MPSGSMSHGLASSISAKRGAFQSTARWAAGVAAAGLLLLIVLSIWSLTISRYQHAHNKVPGAFYSVDGRQMHLYCSGEGAPTIVIEAGLGRDWLDWQGVQPDLSRLTRVCTYDRSGLGWSEPRSGSHDAEAIAHQLHLLLDEAKIPRPLVVAGHSGGGLYVREFAREYPDEVAAVVLIDSTSPQQFDEPGESRAFQKFLRESPRRLFWEKVRVWSGLQRLTGRCKGRPPMDLANMSGQYDAEKCRPQYIGADFGDYVDLEVAAKQAGRLTSLGSKPLLILSRDPDQRTNRMTREDENELAAWDREQEELKSLSRMSRRVIARGSGHEIIHARPDVFLAEMSGLVTCLRGGEAPQFGITETK